MIVEKVTETDITNLAKLMLKSKPALAALGDISRLPAYQDIVDKEGKLKEPSKLFFK